MLTNNSDNSVFDITNCVVTMISCTVDDISTFGLLAQIILTIIEIILTLFNDFLLRITVRPHKNTLFCLAA